MIFICLSSDRHFGGVYPSPLLNDDAVLSTYGFGVGVFSLVLEDTYNVIAV